ncbi:TRAP transporter substrate-binding protein [Oceanospirillaceae bacterium G-43]|uniref:TRAP transporter substrate-binding protein n=2 Tax=Parathalassolituus penaei TaxID=2997323 RepID=A0A9X3EHN7_9GAMM|nr:TRAP transporter substrate-binding protein [Parathalassolituus penaei]MCY0967395.1 TRAP transporter substrate-binding protein [Parathalassolituus penaei]
MLASGSVLAETVLRVGTWLPPTNAQNAVVWPTWAKWVEEATEGRVKVTIENTSGHPKTLFQAVEDGVYDASFSFNGYVPGQFTLPQIVELPGLGAGAEASSVALWRVYTSRLAKANEFEGLELIGMFTHGPGQIHTREPISSLADLKGKKIRVGGGVQTTLGERMEVTPVGAPAPKVYEMLQQGVIDGVFLPVMEQKVLRLNEVTKYLTVLPDGMYMGAFSIFINPDFMDSLSEQDRAAILSVSGEKLSAMAGRAWDAGDQEGYAAAEAAGVTINRVQPGSPMAVEFEKLTAGMDQQWIDSVKDRGVDAAAALAELREIARNYQAPVAK